MANYNPLIVRGNFFPSIDLATPTFVDVSSEVTEFKIASTVQSIEIPPTLANPIGYRGGGASYQLTISYLATDGATGSLFPLLWQALSTSTKTLDWRGSMRDDVVSTSNPLWQGTFVVVQVELGGSAETLSVGSATFPMTGAPTQVYA